MFDCSEAGPPAADSRPRSRGPIARAQWAVAAAAGPHGGAHAHLRPRKATTPTACQRGAVAQGG